MSKVTFFTVVDESFLPGALALMRSVKKYFPCVVRSIVLTESKSLKNKIKSRDRGLNVIEKSKSRIRPSDTYYRDSFSRFFVNDIPGDYLVYLDADIILSGRVNELLEVPEHKLGLVSESYCGYTGKDQFRRSATKYVMRTFGVCLDNPSFNTGVISGHRGAWIKIQNEVELFYKNYKEVFDLSKGNQGVMFLILNLGNIYYALPRICNEIKTQTWNEDEPVVLHFTKGNTRPWRTGSSRRDNSYPAFREWRKYSHALDFTLNGAFLQELFWRSLDDIRPFVRRFR